MLFSYPDYTPAMKRIDIVSHNRQGVTAELKRHHARMISDLWDVGLRSMLNDKVLQSQFYDM